jgi:GTP-binding protein YchF
VDAQNYPFCTIEPNKGIVPIPDTRLDVLSKISGTEKILHATIEFTDIAGLVKGASQGEGLGNKFLAHIRETSAIAHVVRCFEDENIVHVHGELDPLRDVEIIEVELILADYATAQQLVATQGKKIKGGQKEDKERLELFKKIEDQLGRSLPVRLMHFTAEEEQLLKGYYFITQKPVIYVANISENEIGKETPAIKQLKEYAAKHNSPFLSICSKLEAELATLAPEEKAEFLQSYGLTESGLGLLAQTCFQLLKLQTYLTTGVKETRAWTINKGDTAPKAAGVIHTDFEKGFIRANIVSYPDFVACQGWKVAKEKGLLRQEGKEYIMQDGDIVEFLFNV